MNIKGSSYSHLIVALVLIGLFSFAVIGFATQFAFDNNSSVDIADDPEISSLYSTTEGNLTDFNTQSEESYKSIVNSSIGTAGQTTPTAGAFTLTPPKAIGITRNILKTGYTKIFGSDSGFGIFITSFISLLTFFAFLALWKIWAGRSPD